MEIKARCKYDYDSIKALTRFTMFKKANPKKRLIFWTVVYALLFGIMVLEIILFDVDTILTVLLGVEIVMLLILYFCYFFIPKIQYKSMSKMKDIENKYIFFDSEVKVVSESDEYNGEALIQYSFFVRAYETAKYLFLFQTKHQVFVIDKNTIEDGTAKEIRNKLSAYIKDKYVICKY